MVYWHFCALKEPLHETGLSSVIDELAAIKSRKPSNGYEFYDDSYRRRQFGRGE